jgi:hypothetical protein
MKTAYELAMERLNKSSPAVPLTAGQRAELRELESKYTAKVAEREIALKGAIDRALSAGESEKADELQRQWVEERRALQAELEAKKETVRARKS